MGWAGVAWWITGNSPARAGRAAQAHEEEGKANVRLLTTVPNWRTPERGGKVWGCKVEFGCPSVAIGHGEACAEYAQFLADQAQQVDAAGGAATVGVAATGCAWAHMAKPSGGAPCIPGGGVPGVARLPRASRKDGASVSIKRGANLATTTQPKGAKSRVHANIDPKGGGSVQVPCGKAAAKEGAGMAHGAIVVEIVCAKGAKPVLVEFGSGEIAWVAAPCQAGMRLDYKNSAHSENC